LKEYLPHFESQLPSVISGKSSEFDYQAEREMMYNVILELRKEIDEVKKITVDLLHGKPLSGNFSKTIPDMYHSKTEVEEKYIDLANKPNFDDEDVDFFEDVDDNPISNFTIQEQEIQMIKNSLNKHKGKRKLAAQELGISERTLYRKIKEYDL